MTAEFKLSRRLEGVSESVTLKLNALVQNLKAKGRDIVNLTAGEPDFPVPEAAKQAVIDAVNANRSKYTPVAGLPELRELIARKTNLQQPGVSDRRPWEARDVLVCNGAKQAIFNFLLAVLNPGDEVIIPRPYWLSYPEMVKVAGGVPVILATAFEEGFKLTPAALDAAIGSRSKVLMLNSPCNPTGAMYSRAELAALGEVLTRHPLGKGVCVLSDEIYDQIAFGPMPFCSFLESVPALRDRCVTVNGLSKSAAMTGWRSGWAVGPESIISDMATLQGQSTSGICALTQWASIAALRLPDAHYKQNAATLLKKRDLALDILRKSAKMYVRTPEGAFYAFLGVRNCLKAGEDSVAFAERLLQEAGVAVVPGTPFGEPDFIRLSFATDEKSLRAGCERLVSYAN